MECNVWFSSVIQVCVLGFRCTIQRQNVLVQCSQPLWDRGPAIIIIIIIIIIILEEGPVPTNLLVNTFPVFLSSYVELT